MSTENESLEPLQLEKYTSRKVKGTLGRDEETPDSLGDWVAHYLALAVTGMTPAARRATSD